MASGSIRRRFEGDFQGSSQKRTDNFTLLGIGVSVDQKVPWFATLRGRIGYAPGPWLFYLTGGAAWGKYEVSASALGLQVSASETQSAWTVGGGVEWMFMPNWSGKLEYLYIDTGDLDNSVAGLTFTTRAKDNVVRVGLNYHF